MNKLSLLLVALAIHSSGAASITDVVAANGNYTQLVNAVVTTPGVVDAIASAGNVSK